MLAIAMTAKIIFTFYINVLAACANYFSPCIGTRGGHIVIETTMYKVWLESKAQCFG